MNSASQKRKNVRAQLFSGKNREPAHNDLDEEEWLLPNWEVYIKLNFELPDPGAPKAVDELRKMVEHCISRHQPLHYNVLGIGDFRRSLNQAAQEQAEPSRGPLDQDEPGAADTSTLDSVENAMDLDAENFYTRLGAHFLICLMLHCYLRQHCMLLFVIYKVMNFSTCVGHLWAKAHGHMATFFAPPFSHLQSSMCRLHTEPTHYD